MRNDLKLLADDLINVLDQMEFIVRQLRRGEKVEFPYSNLDARIANAQSLFKSFVSHLEKDEFSS